MYEDVNQQGANPAPRRLKLVMPQSHPKEAQTPEPRESSSPRRPTSGSPERPSYSPVTPTMSEAVLPVQQPTNADSRPAPEFIDTPEAPPVSLDDNTDAIALRAALSILQLQRQQSLRDIRDLDKMKAAVMEDPEGFVERLKSGNDNTTVRHGVEVDVDHDESDEDDESADSEKSSKFPKFPAPQNVVRAPPIEWSKYGIVGEPLEKMHEMQKKYPGTVPGQVSQQPHQIAAPYKPFTDKTMPTKK